MEDPYASRCCVLGCRNKQTDEKLSFFPIPKEPTRRAAWLNAIGRNDLLYREDASARVCSKHFGVPGILEKAITRQLPDAVPTKYLPTSVYQSSLIYEHDEGITDMATQTDITYGANPPAPEIDVFVEIFGRKIMLKKESDPEIPNLSTFMLERPIKRESGDDMGESSGIKKRKM